MVALTRSTAFTPLPAARLNSYADEIERLATGLFGNLTNTAVPLVSVRRTSVFTVANAVDTVIPWQTADDDPEDWWDPGTPTRLTARTAALYFAVAQVRYPSTNTTGVRNSLMLKNGTAVLSNSFANDSRPGSTTGDGPTVNYSKPIRLAVGDWLALNVYQTSGVSVDLQLNYGGTTYTVFRIGP